MSRLAEEVVIWTTHEFSFARLDDAWATGSSIMPQKKNPDIAELARGKTGRLIGNLAGLLATLKALPLAYNRDLQEDKEPVIDSVAQLLAGAAGHGRAWWPPCASTPTGWPPWRPRGSRWPPTSRSGWCARACPFRVAHEVAGACVRTCEQRGLELHELSDDDLSRDQPPPAPRRAARCWTSTGPSPRATPSGGTAPVRVAEQRDDLREQLCRRRRPWAREPQHR